MPLHLAMPNKFAHKKAEDDTILQMVPNRKRSTSSILSGCLFNFYAENIMKNAGLDETQAGIKIAREVSVTSNTQKTPPLWQKVKRN